MWYMGDDPFGSPKRSSPFSSPNDHSMGYFTNSPRHERRGWDNHHHGHNNNNNRKHSHFPFSDTSSTGPEPSITDHHYIPKFDTLHPTHLNLPLRSARTLAPNETLILPPSLPRLKISLYSPHGYSLTRSLQVAVAGDMRLRDVIKQVLSSEYLVDARTCVKLRGEWNEVGAPVRVGEIVGVGRYGVNERGEVEVRVVLGGGDGVRVGGMGQGPRFGWERGSVERLRVY